jgi:hypothetical protein
MRQMRQPYFVFKIAVIKKLIAPERQEVRTTCAPQGRTVGGDQLNSVCALYKKVGLAKNGFRTSPVLKY